MFRRFLSVSASETERDDLMTALMISWLAMAVVMMAALVHALRRDQ